MLGVLFRSTRDRFIVPRFHLLGVAAVGWFAFAFDTASRIHTVAENYYAVIELDS